MARKASEWRAIEPDWRAGIKSKSQLSVEYSISRAAMDKHFGDLGIKRDLGAKIKAAAEAMVAQDAVTNEVTHPPKVTNGDLEVTAERLEVTETQIVSANAQLLADAMRRHRSGLVTAWEVVDMLMAELRHQTANQDMYEQLGELLYSPDKNGVDKLNEIYRKALSLPSRAGTAKQLIDAIKVAITMEREVLNITSGESEEGGANGGKGNTTNIFIGLPATSGFFGRVAAGGSGRTLSQPVQDRPLLSTAVRAQPA